MKISIITATYNSEKTIRYTLESVLEQTYNDIEYIIVDGASKDSTLDIVRQYEPQFGGRMRIYSEPDKGIYDALNKGINYATGDVIGFIHADDMLYDSSIIETINNTFINQKCDISYGDMIMVNDQNNKVVRVWKSQKYSPKLFKRGWVAAHPTVYITKALYNEVGYYDLKYPISADYDFIIRAFKSTNNIAYIAQYIVKMRVGGTSSQTRNFKVMLVENWQIIRANHIGGIYTLFMKKFSKIFQFIIKKLLLSGKNGMCVIYLA